MSLLSELSTALAEAVETASSSLVLVNARRGYGASGLVWKPEGLIITANHVVQRDDGITVTPPEGTVVSARIVGRDPGTDLAVLMAEASFADTIEPAERDAQVGNLVLALGSQGGGPPVASFGVVATINRPWRSARGHSIEELIRSDVTLYPGFSGGPLVDASGRVLGMNTSALTRGLAATLPWSLVEEVAGALVSRGSMKRGYLGVVSQPVEIPQQMRELSGIDQESGLLVIAVEPDSPAAIAGLMVGDILVGIKGRSITGIEDLQQVLGPGSSGEAVQTNVIRGGSVTEATVSIGER
jgi:S1-C subfamily serine protease